MSTSTISERREHLRSIGVTASCSLFGVAAGVLSYVVVGADEAAAGNSLGLAIAVGAIVAQYLIVQVAGLYDEEEFGFKHYFFISFMIFSFWFVTWGILLTESVFN
ncbi:hypothetical protein [Halovivax limisalsi]|uniref:EMC6-like membrane protein n=1 Tax=Halovivax limisalsi TaxID=1453760 RepID=UPI001FFD5F83|nr:hypothetical protein [Halovivax limisalsi]